METVKNMTEVHNLIESDFTVMATTVNAREQFRNKALVLKTIGHLQIEIFMCFNKIVLELVN